VKALPPASEVEAFCTALARETGLRFGADKQPLLAELLRARVLHTDSQTAVAYIDRLATAPSELAELARTLTVNETYFLRNQEQFHALAALLRQREQTSIRHLRLLSAGCSSGEEAYSIGITIRETLQNLDEWTISILAIDLNPDVIERARSGAYGRWSLRETPDVIRMKYFEERSGGQRYAIAHSIRNMVRFEPQNLARPPIGFWRHAAFDVVFCRNVLMYFTPEVARRILAQIAHSLGTKGHLFLGHAENLRGLSDDFHLRHSHDAFYYERKATIGPLTPPSEPNPAREAEAPAHTVLHPSPDPSPDPSWFEAIARASNRIEQLSRHSAHSTDEVQPAPRLSSEPSTVSGAGRESGALHLLKQERFHEALRVLTHESPHTTSEPDGLLLEAVLLLASGDMVEAVKACERLLVRDELNAGAHYVTAMCCEQSGDPVGAVDHSRAAAYLDFTFAMPHLQLGKLARRVGDLATARRELKLALDLLAEEDAARILLFGGGFGRDALLQLCRGELTACGAAA